MAGRTFLSVYFLVTLSYTKLQRSCNRWDRLTRLSIGLASYYENTSSLPESGACATYLQRHRDRAGELDLDHHLLHRQLQQKGSQR